ncbi:MAG: hypothetical protein MJA83_05645 [Gammaproteobacteria bacterium]|nr:hypothetical protein [Gammaproteobacteria bacterium]
MATLVVPTRVTPTEYRQQVTLDGVVFRMLFKYNARDDFWYMDIRDLGGEPIRLGIKLVTGFSLLRLVADTNVRPAGVMIVADATDQNIEAGLNAIGVDTLLTYIEQSGVPAGLR